MPLKYKYTTKEVTASCANATIKKWASEKRVDMPPEEIPEGAIGRLSVGNKYFDASNEEGFFALYYSFFHDLVSYIAELESFGGKPAKWSQFCFIGDSYIFVITTSSKMKTVEFIKIKLSDIISIITQPIIKTFAGHQLTINYKNQGNKFSTNLLLDAEDVSVNFIDHLRRVTFVKDIGIIPDATLKRA